MVNMGNMQSNGDSPDRALEGCSLQSVGIKSYDYH